MSVWRALWAGARARRGPLPRALSTRPTINLDEGAVQSYLRRVLLEYDALRTGAQADRAARARLQDIGRVVRVLDERLLLHDSIDSLTELNKRGAEDEEMKKQIREEAKIYLARLKEIDGELVDVLLETTLTEGGVLVEISSGAGGQEAMLFARELLRMYESYAKYKEWEVDVASLDKSDVGGIRKGSLLIEGLGAEQFMKIEAGVHRVQRIPATEKSGRIHTSTVTVAVLPQATEVELELPERDLQIETKRASGAGGQHVNTTDSAVRIVHLPTGTAVECQEGRSQIKNRQIALQKLRTLLLQRQIEEQSSKIKAERQSQVGSGERNEKIRTYNYPQDRVTEHRAGGATVHGIKFFMQGGEQLEVIQQGVLRQMRYQKIMEEINQMEKSDVDVKGS